MRLRLASTDRSLLLIVSLVVFIDLLGFGMVGGVALYHRAATLPFWTAGTVVALGLAAAWIAVARGRDWAEAGGGLKMKDEG